MTLYLWDASDYDWPRGPMDLRAAKADGIVGFTYKATEGTTVKHVHTGEALARARDAGMEFIGAYHVVRTGNVAGQVAYFLAYLDQCAPWWRSFSGFFLQVDLELWPYDAVSAATGMDFARQLVAAQPKKVITYASRGQYGNQLTGIVTPLWNAAYGPNPVAHYPDAYRGDASLNWSPYSGQAPVFWQYGSQLRIGTQPGADCSAFRGSLDDLRALIKGDTMPTADEIAAAVWATPMGGTFHDTTDVSDAAAAGPASEHLKFVINDHNFLVALDKKLDQVIALLQNATPPSGVAPHTHEGGTSGPVAQ